MEVSSNVASRPGINTGIVIGACERCNLWATQLPEYVKLMMDKVHIAPLKRHIHHQVACCHSTESPHSIAYQNSLGKMASYFLRFIEQHPANNMLIHITDG